jgi:hypothetical protein
VAKHSDGPWEVFQSGRDEALYVASHKGNVVAFLAPEDEDENADLIAAAPDMLAALVAAIDCGMIPITSAKEGGAAVHSIQVRVADQIRDAIAKATGETE